MGTPGFVYVLSNPSMPGIVKIGRSTRHPELRAQELYKTSSGVPEPFVLEFAIYAKYDHEEHEEQIHESFKQFRVNGSREFFRVEVELAVEVMSSSVLGDFQVIACSEPYWIDPSITDALAEEIGTHPIMVRDALLDVTPEEAMVLFVRHQKRVNERFARRQRIDGAENGTA